MALVFIRKWLTKQLGMMLCVSMCQLGGGEGERRRGGEGEKREGRGVRRKGVDVGLISVPSCAPKGVIELGCRLLLMKGSSILVESCWRIVGNVSCGTREYNY